MPRRNKVTSGAYETRTDVRVIATLCKYYVDLGDHPASLGSLIAAALDDFMSILIANKLVEEIGDTLEAKKYLEATFGKATHRRGTRALIRQIQVETLAQDRPQPLGVEEIKFGERPE